MAERFNAMLALKALVQALPDLMGQRTQEAADLAEMLRTKALPPHTAAYVVPTGLRPRSEGDAGTGYFIQPVDELFAVVLVVRTAGDATGGKGLAKVDELVWQIVDAVAGRDDGDDGQAIGVFRFAGGQIHSVTAGAIFYQVNFAIQQQLRTSP